MIATRRTDDSAAPTFDCSSFPCTTAPVAGLAVTPSERDKIIGARFIHAAAVERRELQLADRLTVLLHGSVRQHFYGQTRLKRNRSSSLGTNRASISGDKNAVRADAEITVPCVAHAARGLHREQAVAVDGEVERTGSVDQVALGEIGPMGHDEGKSLDNAGLRVGRRVVSRINTEELTVRLESARFYVGKDVG